MGLVPSVSSGGSATFAVCDGVAWVSEGPLRRWDKAAKTIASVWVSDGDSLLDTRVSLASSSSRNRSISALVAANSAWGFEIMTVSLSEVLESPAADLLAAVFYGMVTRVLGNSG